MYYWAPWEPLLVRHTTFSFILKFQFFTFVVYKRITIAADLRSLMNVILKILIKYYVFLYENQFISLFTIFNVSYLYKTLITLTVFNISTYILLYDKCCYVKMFTLELLYKQVTV